MSSDLTEYARTRAPDLREALVIRHLPLVKFVARKLSNSLPEHIELDDLVSWGSLGLLDAIDKFDPRRNVRFSTYAVTRIRGAILDGLQSMDWAPKQVTSKVRTLRRAREALTNDLGRDPTTAQLAERMGATEAEVRGWLVDDQHTFLRPLAIEGVDHYEDGVRQTAVHLADAPDQEVAGEVAEIRQRVAATVRSLPERERAVFLLYYRDSLTLKEIASHLGVSISSATQAHTRLVESVRDRLAIVGATNRSVEARRSAA